MKWFKYLRIAGTVGWKLVQYFLVLNRDGKIDLAELFQVLGDAAQMGGLDRVAEGFRRAEAATESVFEDHPDVKDRLSVNF